MPAPVDLAVGKAIGTSTRKDGRSWAEESGGARQEDRPSSQQGHAAMQMQGHLHLLNEHLWAGACALGMEPGPHAC